MSLFLFYDFEFVGGGSSSLTMTAPAQARCDECAKVLPYSQSVSLLITTGWAWCGNSHHRQSEFEPV